MKSNNKEIGKQSNKSEQPLLALNQAKIYIYHDRMDIGNLTQQINSINSIETNHTLTEIPESFQSISFNQSDLVFRFIEKDKKIFISKIYSCQKPFLQLLVENQQQRKTLHQILRKKWCEAGFQEQYQKLQQIGKGAMSKVFLISRISDNKKFAAKIISLKIDSQKAYDTFINETKILRILTSPYVVGLQGVYISQKKEMIEVLQYLNGGTLFNQIKYDKLKSSRDKLKVIKEVTLGLEHLRQKRIVHRDLKLQNILIRFSENGQKQYVITDFGLSNWVGEKRILYEKCGTPGYLAPEVLNEKKGVCLLNHSSDIFSLGILFHFIYMGYGVFPFQGCPKKLLELNKKGEFSLTQTQKCLHDLEFVLIKKTLDQDPDARPSSKELLQKYIPCLQYYIEKKYGKERKNRLVTSLNTQQLKVNQTTEDKIPSYRKKTITVTQVSKGKHVKDASKQDKNSSRVLISSAKKAIIGAVNRISKSFSRQQKQKLKSKDKANKRQQMKSFVQ